MSNITVYTTNYCPYCVRAKNILKNYSLDFEEINVEDDNKRQALIQKSGRKTVPQIYFGDYHVGGCDDLQVLEKNGQLLSLVEKHAPKAKTLA